MRKLRNLTKKSKDYLKRYAIVSYKMLLKKQITFMIRDSKKGIPKKIKHSYGNLVYQNEDIFNLK